MTSLLGATVLVLAQIVGSEFAYTVKQGESLTSVGARFGVDVRVLAEENDLASTKHLQPGQLLKIDNRHIVPPAIDNEEAKLVVNVPQRMLFFLGEGLLRAYPIAAGSRGWKTPLGAFTIALKETDPTWDVPVSIQAEMRRTGKPVLTRVLPGPQNPLGKYWIGLSIPGVGIHGTNAPLSIYGNVTHGCMRLHPDDISALFSEIRVGDRGRIVYEPALLAGTAEGVFLEVHQDVYKKGGDPLQIVLDRAREEGLFHALDMTRVLETIRRHDGIARDVTKR
jgi:L,D-transpeptidase ErfK/SrfK